MLLSAVSVLVVAQSSSEVPEGLMNNPVHSLRRVHISYKIVLSLLTSIIEPKLTFIIYCLIIFYFFHEIVHIF